MASQNDEAVLNELFPQDATLMNQTSQFDCVERQSSVPVPAEAVAKEQDGIRAANAGDFGVAIERFTESMEIAPSFSSAYNNRAQARRLACDLPGIYRFLSV